MKTTIQQLKSRLSVLEEKKSLLANEIFDENNELKVDCENRWREWLELGDDIHDLEMFIAMESR